MREVKVDSSFWQVFPDAQINVLIVKNIDQSLDKDKLSTIKKILVNAHKEAQSYLTETVFSENQIVKEWRAAFQKFKTKKGARSSIESLFKRIEQGKEIQSIEPLVDCYNSISLKYAVPVGGEDLEQVVGDIQLIQTEGGESFVPLGAEKDSPALNGEIIYKDEIGAMCRCLNWREAQRTMLTEKTKEAIFFIEAINSEQIERANQATIELKKLLEQHFNASITLTNLTTKEAKLTTN